MAIATNASSLTSSGGYSNSLTVSHTVAGSDRLLLVGIHCRTATADVTGVTYGGVAMTLVGTNENTSVVGMQWYRLIAPAVGTANVVVSLANYRLFSVVIYSLTGVDQTTPIEASDFSIANLDGFGTSLSTNITTLSNNARIVTMVTTKDDASPFTAGGSATILQSGDDPDASLGSEALQILDVPTAGSTAYSITWTTSTNWRGGTLVLKPVAASTYFPSPFKLGLFGSNRATGAQFRPIRIKNPTNGQRICIGNFNREMSLKSITSVVQGTTPSVTFSITQSGTFNAAQSYTCQSGIVCANTTTGVYTSAINYNYIWPNNYVFLTITALSGTVTEFHATLNF